MSGALLRKLSLDYAHAADHLDGAAYAAVFTPDGELWVPGDTTGRAPTVCVAGRQRLERTPSGLAHYHATHHRVGTATYAIDGETATGEVTGVAHHLAAAGEDDERSSPGVDTIWYLRYVDDYRRLDGRWLIARRILHLRWIEERPITVLGPGRTPG